jgi:hypothetical protein
VIPNTVVRMDKDEKGREIALVDCDGVRLVCHHAREGIWCCCGEDGHAQCCCAPTLEGAITAWCRNDELGE